MSDLPAKTPPQPEKPPLGFLAVIAAYKLLKAIASIAGAIFILRIRNRDLEELAWRLLEKIGANSERWLATHVLLFISKLNPQKLLTVALIMFGYSVIYTLEGVGLFMEKTWAEWLTVIQTGLLMPWELYEIARRPSLAHFGIFVANLIVVLYLVWRLKRDADRKHRREMPTSGM
ncbi:MAG TPA: DUF2127 domain-containing protein [Tepidisphaeraceae bacterium]|nr:DUF2127 domain-containing protein [Tepidisphaeraceae bacterium]